MEERALPSVRPFVCPACCMRPALIFQSFRFLAPPPPLHVSVRARFVETVRHLTWRRRRRRRRQPLCWKTLHNLETSFKGLGDVAPLVLGGLRRCSGRSPNALRSEQKHVHKLPHWLTNL